MERCTNCDAPLLGTRYCTNCGAPVPVDADSDEATQALPPDDLAGAREETVAVSTTETIGDEPVDPDPDDRRPLLLLVAALLLLLAGGAVLLSYLRDDPERTTQVASPVTATPTTPAPVVTIPTETASPVPTTSPGTTTSPEATTPGATTSPDLDATLSPGTSLPGSTSSPTTTALPTTTTSAPTTGGSAGSGATGTTGTVPSATPFYVVVVASKNQAEGGRSAAEALLPQAQAAGQPTLLFESSTYSSLRPGYWVAAAGPFSDRSAAVAAVSQMRSANPALADAYPRCVGTVAECGQ